jgi:hypothetical protein
MSIKQADALFAIKEASNCLKDEHDIATDTLVRTIDQIQLGLTGNASPPIYLVRFFGSLACRKQFFFSLMKPQ